MTSYVTTASYLPFGPMRSMGYGNGLVKTMACDARYRPVGGLPSPPGPSPRTARAG